MIREISRVSQSPDKTLETYLSEANETNQHEISKAIEIFVVFSLFINISFQISQHHACDVINCLICITNDQPLCSKF